MKAIKADYQEHIERYLHCPGCEILISDDDNIDDGEISEGNIIKCPNCGISIEIHSKRV